MLRAPLLDVLNKLSKLTEITQHLSIAIEATTKCREPAQLLNTTNINKLNEHVADEIFTLPEDSATWSRRACSISYSVLPHRMST